MPNHCPPVARCSRKRREGTAIATCSAGALPGIASGESGASMPVFSAFPSQHCSTTNSNLELHACASNDLIDEDKHENHCVTHEPKHKKEFIKFIVLNIQCIHAHRAAPTSAERVVRPPCSGTRPQFYKLNAAICGLHTSSLVLLAPFMSPRLGNG